MDRDEFARCWHRHVYRVTAYAERHVGRDAAPDIASATFLTAWLNWQSVPHAALPWLISAARGHVRNHLRSERRRAGLSQRLELLDQSAYRGPDTALTAEDRMAALTVLATMPEHEREALLLVAWDGLTTEEAAEVMGCPPGAMRTRIHRARTRLEEALATATSERLGASDE
jgi:RNA polymerase sigma-70 factor (ECF subfamily)